MALMLQTCARWQEGEESMRGVGACRGFADPVVVAQGHQCDLLSCSHNLLHGLQSKTVQFKYQTLRQLLRWLVSLLKVVQMGDFGSLQANGGNGGAHGLWFDKWCWELNAVSWVFSSYYTLVVIHSLHIYWWYWRKSYNLVFPDAVYSSKCVLWFYVKASLNILKYSLQNMCLKASLDKIFICFRMGLSCLRSGLTLTDKGQKVAEILREK